MNLNSINDYIYLILFSFPCIYYFYIISLLKKYNKETSNSKMSGFDIARKILDKNKCEDYVIIETPEDLSDNYNLQRETLKLSSNNYHNDSVTSYAYSSFISYKIVHDLKLNNIAKFKNEFDKIIKYIIGIMYILLFVGALLNNVNLVDLSVGVLLFIFIYYIFTSIYRFNIYNEIKDNDKYFDDHKIIYRALILFDYINFINIIVSVIKDIKNKYF